MTIATPCHALRLNKAICKKKKRSTLKIIGKHYFSQLWESVSILESSLILYITHATQSVSKPTSALSCAVIWLFSHNLCMQSCHALLSSRDWPIRGSKVVRKGQIHSHTEKLGSGRLVFLVENLKTLYHLESRCIYYKQLNRKVRWLHAVELGGRLANLRSSIHRE